MVTTIPFKKIIRVALLIIPFISISGIIPGILFGNLSSAKIIGGFLLILSLNAIAWSVNIGLLYFSFKWKVLARIWLRFIISSIIICSIAFFVFLLVRTKVLAEEFPIPQAVLVFAKRAAVLPVTQAFSFNVIIYILIELILLREIKNRISLENEQLKSANLESRINSLKEQLHPHFLFNSLSTLRSLINRSPEKATEYLERLSELLRFSSGNNDSVILLKDEVTLTENYLTMQKVRFGNALNFEVNIPAGKQNNLKIPAYSLQQLAENAIKHNTLTVENPLLILIKYNGITKEITVTNNLQPKYTTEATSGTGLANLNERYQLLGCGGITIQNISNQFVVSIKLLENESNYN
jgi:two-component system, LytTR family, sensor kinase